MVLGQAAPLSPTCGWTELRGGSGTQQGVKARELVPRMDTVVTVCIHFSALPLPGLATSAA